MPRSFPTFFLNISLSPANPCLWLIRVYWHHPFHVNTTSFVWLLSLIATVRLTKVREQKAILSISNSLHNTSPGVTKAKQQTKKVLFLKRRKMKCFLTRGLRSDCWGWISIIVLSLPYITKHLVVTVVVIWCYWNKIEVNWTELPKQQLKTLYSLAIQNTVGRVIQNGISETP